MFEVGDAVSSREWEIVQTKEEEGFLPGFISTAARKRYELFLKREVHKSPDHLQVVKAIPNNGGSQGNFSKKGCRNVSEGEKGVGGKKKRAFDSDEGTLGNSPGGGAGNR